jgi:glycosyltransferase involved in cell wall biosynthesis
MTSLYQNDRIKALVNIGHGEGYGLPIFEAAYNGLPVVSGGWSGQLDFLTHKGKDMYAKVNHTLQPVQQEAVWPGVIEKDSMWAFADQGSYKMTLRKMKKEHAKYKRKANKLKTIIENDFTSDNMYAQFMSHLNTNKE